MARNLATAMAEVSGAAAGSQSPSAPPPGFLGTEPNRSHCETHTHLGGGSAFRSGTQLRKGGSFSKIQGPAEVTPLCVVGRVGVSHETDSNVTISPKMSYGVLQCDVVMLQNYMLL